MPAATSIALGAGAALGGIGGALGGSGGSDPRNRFQLGPTSRLEEILTGRRRSFKLVPGMEDQGPQLVEDETGPGLLTEQFNEFGLDIAAQGLTRADIGAGVGAQRDVASELQRLAQTQGLPGAQDISRAQGFARDIFAPQQLALRQQFAQQRGQAAQQAAVLGRGPSDPVLLNKLAQSQAQQQALLGAQQGSLSAQFAQTLPTRRLGFLQQRAGVLGGLGQQAMQNRLSILGLGSQLLGQERGFQLQRGEQVGGTPGTSTGQRISQGIFGGIAGIGAAGSVAGAFGGATGVTSAR